MLAKIVVGIDGRQGGEDALALARQLGSGTAEILLCEVVVTGGPSRATRPRSSLGRLLFGTTSDALSHGLACPLIAVPRVPAPPPTPTAKEAER